VALGQIATFSGTWRLVEDRSRIDAEAPLAGLIGTGAPSTLHVTAPANGTLVVESQANESHSRFYVPGARTTTPIFLGAAGTITMTSRWEEGALVSEGTRAHASDTGDASTKVKEVFTLGEGGRRLQIRVSVSSAHGESKSTLTYRRIRDVGPCESWPSPCKAFVPRKR